MWNPPDLAELAATLAAAPPSAIAAERLDPRVALPTVNPGDDDEDDDEDDGGNIEPDEDEGLDDDEEDDEGDPLWARGRPLQGSGRSARLLLRNKPLIRFASHRRHTARPASPGVAF